MLEKKEFLIKILANVSRALVFSLIFFMIVNFLSGKIEKITKSVMEQKRSSFILSRRDETKKQLLSDFAIIGDGDAKILSAFPPEENILDFVSYLDNLSTQTSVSQKYSFGVPTNGRIDYGISVGANILSFENYLAKLENMPFFSNVASFELHSPSGDWEKDVSVAVKAVLFTRPR